MTEPIKTRPRALIVDFGGVMTVPERQVFEAFCAETGADPGRLRAIVAGAFDGSDPDGIVARRERGELSLPDFEAALAAALSEGLDEPADPAGLRGRLFAAESVEPAMVRAVTRTRAAGIRTAMLSNTWGEGAEQDALAPLFDAVLLSGRLGMRKPDLRFFAAAADALGVLASECAFVDDIEANVRAAQALGMRGILHRAAGSTIVELDEVFGLR